MDRCKILTGIYYMINRLGKEGLGIRGTFKQRLNKDYQENRTNFTSIIDTMNLVNDSKIRFLRRKGGKRKSTVMWYYELFR